ncbi:MAG: alanine racemase [Hyphomicrobium sp.]|nr:alanine racemase [Hyphomicrobium sp.]
MSQSGMITSGPGIGTGLLTIDVGAVAQNWAALARLVAPAECGAVVKANAYGLGVGAIAPQLEKAGCQSFFVATSDEAAEVRALVGPRASIYVLDGLVPGSADTLVASGAVPCLGSLAEIEEWSARAVQERRSLPAVLHVDSGLGRLGLSGDDVAALSADERHLEPLDVRLVMSHLACADQPAHAKNEAQRAEFDRLRGHLPKMPASLAASDGLMLGSAYHYDLVRPGYGLYGGQAFRGGASPVKPVVKLMLPIIQVRDVAAGESVGYAAAWHALKPSRIAVLPAGYADGIGRGASSSDDTSGGHVLIHGQKAPIAGRVSMDLITVDVTDIVPPVVRGDVALVIGEGLSLEAAGRGSQTIGYEVLTRLGQRYRRRYVDGSEGT